MHINRRNFLSAVGLGHIGTTLPALGAGNKARSKQPALVNRQ